jgi:CheY-specific phosphatase CheX
LSELNKVLLASKNTLWAKDLKKKLIDSKKVRCDITYDRPDAIEKVSATEYDLIVFEDSFEIKNIEYISRALDNSNGLVPSSIIYSLLDIRDLQKIDIPEKIKDSCCAYSVPLSIDVFCDIILNRFLTISATDKSKSSLDKEFVSLLITSTSEVLKDFTLLDFKASKPKLLSSFDPYPEVGIRGKVVIKSDFFTGSLLVSFPNSTFFNVYESVVGEKITSITNDEEDFASSITNMIYGKMKKFLSEKGVELDMVIPTIDSIETLSSDNGPIFVIPFDSSAGSIFIKIAVNLLD